MELLTEIFGTIELPHVLLAIMLLGLPFALKEL